MHDNYGYIIWIKDFVIPLVGVFFGAVLAFWYNNKLQKQIEKRAKEAELKKDRDFKICQLNYLQAYLYAYVEEFFKISKTFEEKMAVYDNIITNNYKFNTDEFDYIRTVFDTTYKFKSNIDNLYFTSDTPAFIQVLATIETNIERFNSHNKFSTDSMQKLLAEIKGKKQDITLKEEMVKNFIKSSRYNLDSSIYLLHVSVVSIDKMLNTFNHYCSKNNLLNDISKIKHSSKDVVSFIEFAKKDIAKPYMYQA